MPGTGLADGGPTAGRAPPTGVGGTPGSATQAGSGTARTRSAGRSASRWRLTPGCSDPSHAATAVRPVADRPCSRWSPAARQGAYPSQGRVAVHPGCHHRQSGPVAEPQAAGASGPVAGWSRRHPVQARSGQSADREWSSFSPSTRPQHVRPPVEINPQRRDHVGGRAVITPVAIDRRPLRLARLVGQIGPHECHRWNYGGECQRGNYSGVHRTRKYIVGRHHPDGVCQPIWVPVSSAPNVPHRVTSSTCPVP